MGKYRKNKLSKTKLVAIALGVIALFLAVMAFGVWVAMLIAGAIAGNHGWYSLGFGETFLWLWAIGIVGSAWNGSLKNLKKLKKD